MVDKVTDFAYSTVLTPPSPELSGTTMVLQAGDGAKFPTGFFYGTTWPADQLPLLSNAEIVRASMSGDTVNMTRAQGPTTAQPISAGYQFALIITAEYIAQIVPQIAGQLLVGVGSDAELRQMFQTTQAPSAHTAQPLEFVEASNSAPVTVSNVSGAPTIVQNIDGSAVTLTPVGGHINSSQAWGATSFPLGTRGAAVLVIGNGTDVNVVAIFSSSAPTPAASVTGPDSFGTGPKVGTSSAYAREDHDHGLPSIPAGVSPATSVVGPDTFGSPSNVGSSNLFAREDHDHGLPPAPGGQSFQPGDIVMTGNTIIPSGWLLCDGSPVSRSTYSALFAAIGTAFGSGDGSTTFNVPDFGSRSPAGPGPIAGSAGSVMDTGTTYGNEEIYVDTGVMPAHTHPDSGHSHTVSDGTHSHSVTMELGAGTAHGGQGVYGVSDTSSGLGDWFSASAGASYSGVSVGEGYANNGSVGSGYPLLNRPPTLVVTFRIKT